MPGTTVPRLLREEAGHLPLIDARALPWLRERRKPLVLPWSPLRAWR